MEYIANSKFETIFASKLYYNSMNGNGDGGSCSSVLQSIVLPAFKLGNFRINEQRMEALDRLKGHVIAHLQGTFLKVYQQMFELDQDNNVRTSCSSSLSSSSSCISSSSCCISSSSSCISSSSTCSSQHYKVVINYISICLYGITTKLTDMDIDKCLSRELSSFHRVDRFENLCLYIREEMRRQLCYCMDRSIQGRHYMHTPHAFHKLL